MRKTPAKPKTKKPKTPVAKRPAQPEPLPDSYRVCFGFGTGGGRRNIRKPLGDE